MSVRWSVRNLRSLHLILPRRRAGAKLFCAGRGSASFFILGLALPILLLSALLMLR